jgi:hypothetical protein
MERVGQVDIASIPVEALSFYGAGFNEWLKERNFKYYGVWMSLGEDEQVAHSRKMEKMKDNELIPYLSKSLAPRVEEMETEQIGSGPNYRTLPLGGRLNYAGVVATPIDEDITVRMFLANANKIAGAVTDTRQLDMKMIDFIKSAAACLATLKEQGANVSVVLGSMEPLASRRQITLSAIFSLPRFAGVKKCKMGNGSWTSPAGTSFECQLDPISRSPLWVKDFAAFAAEIAAITGTNVVVLPGGYAMFETVSAIMCVRKPTWDVDHLFLDTLPSTTASSAYAGYWAQPGKEKKFQDILDKLPAWSKDYPPPQNLAGAARMPEYLHYLLHQVREGGMLPELPQDSIFELYITGRLTDAYADHMMNWIRCRKFSQFYEETKTGKAPIQSLGDACKKGAERRQYDTRNPAFSILTQSSTANGSHNEPRDMNAVVKAQILVQSAKALGAPEPRLIAYTGVGSASAVPALKALSSSASIITYGTMRTKTNSEEFRVWGMEDGFPEACDFLYDDSYGEGDEDIQTRARNKVPSLSRRPGIETAILKFYPDDSWAMRWRNVKDPATGKFKPDVELPCNLNPLVSMFDHVTVKSPGRAHSQEIYFVCTGRRQRPVDEEAARVARIDIYSRIMLKAALMGVANDFRAFCTKYGHPVAFTSHALGHDKAGTRNIVDAAHEQLGFGYTDVYGYVDMQKVVAETKVTTVDEGTEFMPDIAELMRTLPMLELAEPSGPVRPAEDSIEIIAGEGELPHKHRRLSGGAGPSNDPMVDDEPVKDYSDSRGY